VSFLLLAQLSWGGQIPLLVQQQQQKENKGQNTGSQMALQRGFCRIAPQLLDNQHHQENSECKNGKWDVLSDAVDAALGLARWRLIGHSSHELLIAFYNDVWS
jgi:hypothetical protein